MEPSKNDLHQFIDDCWDGWQERRQPIQVDETGPQFEKPTADTPEPTINAALATEVPEVPKDTNLRVVRTKATGDKVYLLNEKEGTKRWLTSPEVLRGFGFDMNDVTEIPDMDLGKYKPVSAFQNNNA